MNEYVFKQLLSFFDLTLDSFKMLNFDIDAEYLRNIFKKINKIEDAVFFLKSAIIAKKRILIYGDYDADGIMGSSILKQMFNYCNYAVETYIPNRYLDGYGITLSKAKEYAERGIELVITVDNGISAFEAINYLKQKNISVIVLDHHNIQENQIPNADFILHPQYSNFLDYETSGAFVSLAFAITFLGRFDKYLSVLASISLISDMMPLKGINRQFLKFVFSQYKEGEFLQIDLLKDGDPFDEDAIGMKIAPKINSVGRIIETDEINKLVSFFTSQDKKLILTYYQWIESVNNDRKKISSEIPKELVENSQNINSVFLKTNYKEGIIGLLANNICKKYQKPTIVFTKDSSNTFYKGSARSPENIDLLSFFTKNKNILITYGGHKCACGCSVENKKMEQFEHDFTDYFSQIHADHIDKTYIDLSIADINKETFETIKIFSPFGEGWKKPTFRIKNISSKSIFYSKNKQHIITQLGFNSKLTGFNISEQYMKKYNFVNLIGTIRASHFNNYTYTEFLIDSVEEAK